jgi:hypothetical protein
MFAKRGNTVVAPNALCLVDHRGLCIGGPAEAGERTITANPKRVKKWGNTWHFTIENIQRFRYK